MLCMVPADKSNKLQEIHSQLKHCNLYRPSNGNRALEKQKF